jgi:hypothetical protein
MKTETIMKTETRELTPDELENVSGGVALNGVDLVMLAIPGVNAAWAMGIVIGNAVNTFRGLN